MILVALIGVGGCGEELAESPEQLAAGDRISVVGGQPFEEIFDVVDTLVLEESRTVVTVAPRVTVESGGGFLVADEAEHQVRVYSNQGRLKEVFGEGTKRVDSIKSPGRALRMPNGDILVVNMRGPLTIIPARHAEPSRFVPKSLRTARSAEVLDGSEVLIVGTDSGPPSATLFRVDLASGRFMANLFPPPPHLDQWVTTFMSSVRTAQRGGRIAAVHMLSDTLVLFGRSGKEQSRVHIPIDPFVAPEGPLPDLTTMAERYAWTAQFTLVMSVFWVDDNQFVVQWEKPWGNGTNVDMGLLQMDTTGALVWAIAPSPFLVAVRGEEFFFRTPQGKAMNEWTVAKRKVTP